MNYSFEDYENAILNALSSLHVKKGGYLRTLKGYAGEIDAEEAIRQFLGNSPGALVEIYSASYTRNSLEFLTQEVQVYIYVAARSVSTQDKARKGEKGVFQILKDIRDILVGNRLGLQIRPVEIKREMKLVSTPHAVLFVAQYVIKNDRISGGQNAS